MEEFPLFLKTCRSSRRTRSSNATFTSRNAVFASRSYAIVAA
jgi:hypothetical protein